MTSVARTELLEVTDVPYGTMPSPYTDTFAPTDGNNFFGLSTTRETALNVNQQMDFGKEISKTRRYYVFNRDQRRFRDDEGCP